MTNYRSSFFYLNPAIAGYAPVNGINMYYEIHGTGEPLVLIHGGGSTIQTSFGRILPLLAQQFKVIAVELQAHGHTSDRNSPESFEQDAERGKPVGRLAMTPQDVRFLKSLRIATDEAE